MIIEYTDCHVHRIRLDFSDLKEELPRLKLSLPEKSKEDVMANEAKLLAAALQVIGDVRSNTKTYEILTYQNNRIWLNGYDK
jgi:hypothetical protein